MYIIIMIHKAISFIQNMFLHTFPFVSFYGFVQFCHEREGVTDTVIDTDTGH